MSGQPFDFLPDGPQWIRRYVLADLLGPPLSQRGSRRRRWQSPVSMAWRAHGADAASPASPQSDLSADGSPPSDDGER